MKNVLKVLVGLALGLVIAEIGFRVRDDGAFPHLNFYVADDVQGARLEPNATMKLRVGDNPLTTVTTNSHGYRGAEWPAVAPGELLVVGDSQVFGLGVEDAETFSMKLADSLKVPVLNLGVPTWGPGEYSTAIEEQLKGRKPAAVIYVLNLSNDLFEADRPNKTRHRVWDGWAVRAETAPADVMGFPLRKTLMSRSHLVFAARKLMHVASTADDGFASEGTWRDVVSASDSFKAEAADEPTRKFLAARARLDTQLKDIAFRLEDNLERKIDDDAVAAQLKKAAHLGDGVDIFEEGDAEGGRSVNTTALHLVTAAMGESKNEALLEKLAASKGDNELKKLIAERKVLREEVRALKTEAVAMQEVPLDRLLKRTKAACDAVGARLIVVGLPLDVMVSADEWKKYAGAKPIDLTPTIALRESLMRRIEAIGAEAFDPTAALAAAEPGAFLKGDLHMTAKGHAALANALVEVVKAGPKKTLLALPPGRSWPPTDDELLTVGECNVKGSTAAHCETRMVREWLWLKCDNEISVLDGVRVTAGGHGDAHFSSQDSVGTLLIPVLEGDATRVFFDWRLGTRELKLDYPAGGKLVMAFSEQQKSMSGPGSGAGGFPRDPLGSDSCEPGQRFGGALHRCAPACDEKKPCSEGHCEPWPTGGFCAVP